MGIAEAVIGKHNYNSTRQFIGEWADINADLVERVAVNDYRSRICDPSGKALRRADMVTEILNTVVC
jgi:hypothetical protein